MLEQTWTAELKLIATKKSSLTRSHQKNLPELSESVTAVSVASL
jgi:hypothetical protein